MSAFDVRTAFVIIAALYFCLPAFTWVVLAPQRKPAVALWCGGGLWIGTAFLLMGLFKTTDVVAVHAAVNLLLILGFLMRVQALRLDLGVAWSNWRVYPSALAFVVVYESLIASVHDDTSRWLLVNVLYVVRISIVMHLVGLSWRIAKVESSHSALWIGRVYLFVAMALLWRGLHLLVGVSGANLLAAGWDTLVLSLSFVVASVVGHVGYVGLALDRSTGREMESAKALARDEVAGRLGAQIAVLDRQRSLGTMAASLGHELNQPLTAILISAQVAQRGLLAGRFESAQMVEFLEKIVASTQRASAVIARIRGFIQPAATRSESVDLALVLHDVSKLVEQEVKSCKAVIFSHPVPEPVRVQGDAIQISQVFLNIFRNALEALAHADQREIHISLRRQEGRARVSIRDTGPGIDAAVLAQVGSPFFTTKVAGLGMGLSISRSILEQFGATLAIRNDDDGGAVVELDFPASRVVAPAGSPRA